MDLERQKNAQLTARITALEAVAQHQEQLLKSRSDNKHLIQQAGEIVHKTTNYVFHGPDTIEHFQSFSVERVITELQTDAPDVYRLFQMLGDTGRNRRPNQEGYSSEELKAMMSACTLLNARSKKVKGLQLLLGIMLVARATSRQVRSTTITINIHTVHQLYSIYHVGNHSTEPCRRMHVIPEYMAVSQTV